MTSTLSKARRIAFEVSLRHMAPRTDEFNGTETIVDTACPLDCPDSCSLAVTVGNGKVVNIDGSTLNAPTGGYICAKVRKFGDRVYGDARLRYPAVRTGPTGRRAFLASRGMKRSSSSPRACWTSASAGAAKR